MASIFTSTVAYYWWTAAKKWPSYCDGWSAEVSWSLSSLQLLWSSNVSLFLYYLPYRITVYAPSKIHIPTMIILHNLFVGVFFKLCLAPIQFSLNLHTYKRLRNLIAWLHTFPHVNLVCTIYRTNDCSVFCIRCRTKAQMHVKNVCSSLSVQLEVPKTHFLRGPSFVFTAVQL